MNIENEIILRECVRCHHRWVPRQTTLPMQCPKCHSPYWQTPRQYSKRGRPPKIQIIDINSEYNTINHKKWGKWSLNKRPPYPTLDFPISNNETYEIKLSRCKTARSRELWLQQLSNKRFITSADLGDLVKAFIDLIRQGEIPTDIVATPKS